MSLLDEDPDHIPFDDPLDHMDSPEGSSFQDSNVDAASLGNGDTYQFHPGQGLQNETSANSNVFNTPSPDDSSNPGFSADGTDLLGFLKEQYAKNPVIRFQGNLDSQSEDPHHRAFQDIQRYMKRSKTQADAYLLNYYEEGCETEKERIDSWAVQYWHTLRNEMLDFFDTEHTKIVEALREWRAKSITNAAKKYRKDSEEAYADGEAALQLWYSTEKSKRKAVLDKWEHGEKRKRQLALDTMTEDKTSTGLAQGPANVAHDSATVMAKKIEMKATSNGSLEYSTPRIVSDGGTRNERVYNADMVKKGNICDNAMSKQIVAAAKGDPATTDEGGEVYSRDLQESNSDNNTLPDLQPDNKIDTMSAGPTGGAAKLQTISNDGLKRFTVARELTAGNDSETVPPILTVDKTNNGEQACKDSELFDLGEGPARDVPSYERMPIAPLGSKPPISDSTTKSVRDGYFSEDPDDDNETNGSHTKQTERAISRPRNTFASPSKSNVLLKQDTGANGTVGKSHEAKFCNTRTTDGPTASSLNTESTHKGKKRARDEDDDGSTSSLKDYSTNTTKVPHPKADDPNKRIRLDGSTRCLPTDSVQEAEKSAVDVTGVGMSKVSQHDSESTTTRIVTGPSSTNGNNSFDVSEVNELPDYDELEKVTSGNDTSSTDLPNIATPPVASGIHEVSTSSNLQISAPSVLHVPTLATPQNSAAAVTQVPTSALSQVSPPSTSQVPPFDTPSSYFQPSKFGRILGEEKLKAEAAKVSSETTARGSGPKGRHAANPGPQATPSKYIFGMTNKLVAPANITKTSATSPAVDTQTPIKSVHEEEL